MEWQWLKDWWRLKRWRSKKKKEQSDDDFCYCDDCLPDVSITLINQHLYNQLHSVLSNFVLTRHMHCSYICLLICL